jgi:hypothetical protein
MKPELKALLAPKQQVMELAPGVEVRIKELSLKERIKWRASVLDGETLKPEWVQSLLQAAVMDLDGEPIWAAVDEVDGSEAILTQLLKMVQAVNGLNTEAVDSAEGN